MPTPVQVSPVGRSEGGGADSQGLREKGGDEGGSRSRIHLESLCNLSSDELLNGLTSDIYFFSKQNWS